MAEENGEFIYVKAGPKAGKRVALYEKDPAHEGAGNKDGEVFVAHDDVVKVAKTPLVEAKLVSRELIETQAPKASEAAQATTGNGGNGGSGANGGGNSNKK